MKCIVVDDERHARENLAYYIGESGLDIELIGQATNVDEAYNLVLEIKPELVFLDISMPLKKGYQLLDMFDNVPFKTVFVSAYAKENKIIDQYSYQGILHKPFDEKKLQELVLHVLFD